MSAHTLSDLLEGRTPRIIEGDDVIEYGQDNWKAEEEGNLKLQKIIRKKLQSLDDPDTPYGYRKGKKDSVLAHALRMNFENPDDARKIKSPEHIEKMQAARKQTMSKYKDNL